MIPRAQLSAALGGFEMIDYLFQNKEWIFSGVGVALVVGVIGLVRGKLRRRSTATTNTQAQRTGAQSTAIQAGRDVVFNPPASQAQPAVRVRVHEAYLEGDPRRRFFINVVNEVNSPEVEITHVWYDGTRRVDILEPTRPLPRRLRPSESWETQVPVDQFPRDPDIYRRFRVRLSTDQVLASEQRHDVPPRGFVPGA